MTIDGATVASMFQSAGNSPVNFSGPIGAWTDAINAGRATVGQLQAQLASGANTPAATMPPAAPSIGGFSPVMLVAVAVAIWFFFFKKD